MLAMGSLCQFFLVKTILIVLLVRFIVTLPINDDENDDLMPDLSYLEERVFR